jgi:hypothetical protein
MLTYANHVGLYSEEIALTGEQIGNFSQAYIRLQLFDAAITLDAGWELRRGDLRRRSVLIHGNHRARQTGHDRARDRFVIRSV